MNTETTTLERRIGNWTATITLVRQVSHNSDVVFVEDVDMHVEGRRYARKNTAKLLEDAAEIFRVAAEDARRLAREEVSPDPQD